MDWAEWILEEPMDQMTADETEDLDYIIALSLAEEGTKPLSSRVKLEEEEDEQLAKAIRVSRKSQSHPQCSRANALRTTHLPSTSKDSSASIWKEEPIEKARGAIWHPDGIGDDHPFHKSCHKEHDDRKCHICKNFLPRTANGVQLRTNHFWMQKYCPSHEHDGTPICSSCMRLEPRDMPYKVLDAGRRLCSQCLKSAVIYCDTFESLQSNVHEFFRGLDMEVDRQIPIHLVQRTTLNETMEVEKNEHHPETRGISVSEGKSVTAILILCDLPRLLTGSIMAHEMMHAWLRLSGYQRLSKKVEEGICQVMAYMWLDAEIGPSDSAAGHVASEFPSDEQLGVFFKYRIEVDDSPDYGEGFKLAHRAVKEYGLKETLHCMQLTGGFPL